MVESENYISIYLYPIWYYIRFLRNNGNDFACSIEVESSASSPGNNKVPPPCLASGDRMEGIATPLLIIVSLYRYVSTYSRERKWTH